MKHDKLADALSELEDRHIQQALQPRRRTGWWMSAIAAVLALAICCGLCFRSGSQPEPALQAPTTEATAPISHVQLSDRYTIVAASYPKMVQYPTEHNETSYYAWSYDQQAFHNQPDGYAESLQPCWNQLVSALLSSTQGENIACSPLNIYIALAMLAECTDGQSRQQLLSLMNAESIEALRLQANRIWNAHYNDDGLNKSVLGSSLWLEDGYRFNTETVTLLSENYYASVFQGDLGSEAMNNALQNWLDQQTGNLLQTQVQNIRFDPTTVLALATTINYQVQWMNFQFSEKANTQGTFHGANGDTAETFMHHELSYGPYYWSEHFGAVALPLEDGSQMWLILPDEGVSPEEIIGEAMAFLADPNKKDQKRLRVDLSLPKFDVCAQQDIVVTLQQLGVTDVFESGVADFSPILSEDDDGYISSVNHTARVTIDENGVTAAAFTVILRAGAGIPSTDEIDFTLDRPFLFFIESADNLPLFAGIVNEP